MPFNDQNHQISEKRPARHKRKHYGYIVVLSCIGIFVLVNIVASLLENHYQLRMDVTENRVYSISSTTKKVLSNLEEDIYLYTFFDSTTYDPNLNEMLYQYVTTSSNHIIKKNLDPIQDQIFISQFEDIQPNITSGSILVTNKDHSRYKLLSIYDMYLLDSQYGIIGLKAEQKITSAIKYVVTGVEYNIRLLSGHGETSAASLSDILNDLENLNYNLSLYQSGSIALNPDTDILMVVSPKQDLTKQEYDEIQQFLGQGGNAIFFIDRQIQTEDTVQSYILTEQFVYFNQIFEEYGLKINQDIIVGTQSSNTYKATTSLIGTMPRHNITKTIKSANLSPIFSYASSIEIEEDHDELTIAPLVETEDNCYALQTSSEKTSSSQSLDSYILGALSTKGDSNIILFSTSSLLSAEDYMLSGNRELVLNSITYLNDSAGGVSVDPKIYTSASLNITSDGQKSLLFILVSIVIPVAILVSGIVTVYRRKKL